MSGFRFAILSPYIWQFIFLLIASLVCGETLCQDVRDEGRDARSLINFNFQHQHSFRINSCMSDQLRTINDEVLSKRTSTEISQTNLARGTKRSLIDYLQFSCSRFHERIRVQKIRLSGVIPSGERTLRRDKDLGSLPRIARTDIRAKTVRTLPVYSNFRQGRQYRLSNEYLLENLPRYSNRNLDKRSMITSPRILPSHYESRRSVERVELTPIDMTGISHNFLNRRSRLVGREDVQKMGTIRIFSSNDAKLFQTNVNNNLPREITKRSRQHFTDLDTNANRQMRQRARAMLIIRNSSHSFRKSKFLDDVRDSRDSQFQKLSTFDSLSRQNEYNELDSSKNTSFVNDYPKQRGRYIQMTRDVRTQRQYSEPINNSRFRSRIEARRLSRKSDHYISSISVDEISSRQVREKLQSRRNTFEDSVNKPAFRIQELEIPTFRRSRTDNSTVFLTNRLFREKRNYMRKSETQQNNLRVNLYSRNIERRRVEDKDIKFVTQNNVIEYFAPERRILSRQQSVPRILISSQSKLSTRRVHKNSPAPNQFSQINSERESTSIENQTLRKIRLLENVNQKVISRRRTAVRLDHQKSQRIVQNVRLVDSKTRNVTQKSESRGFFAPLLQIQRFVQTSRNDHHNDVRNIDEVFFEYEKSASYKKDISNDVIHHIILIGLCAIYGSMSYSEKTTIFRKIQLQVNQLIAW